MMKLLPIPIIIFFITTLFPLLPNISYDYHNSQRALQACTLILCVFFYALTNIQPKIEVNKKVKLLFFVFLALNTFSSALSDYPLSSMLVTSTYALLGFLTYYLANLDDENTYRLWLYLFFTHSCLVFTCLLNLIFTITEFTPLNAHIIYMKFDNIRHFNHLQILILPFSIYLISVLKYKLIIITIVTINIILLLIGNSLAAWVLLPTIWFLFLLLNLNEYLKSYFIILMISITLFFCLTNYLPHPNIESNFFSSSGRFEMWGNTIHHTFGNLFKGIGAGNFSLKVGSSLLSHPHNSLLQLYIEGGLLSVALMVLLCIIIILNSLKNLNELQKSHKVYLVTFISWLIYSLVSGLMVMPLTQVIFCMLAGILMPSKSKKNYKLKFNYSKYLIVLLGIFYSIMFFYSFSLLDGYTPKMAGPSFWSAGERNLDEGMYER